MQTISIGGVVYTVLFPDLLRPLTEDERLRLVSSVRDLGVLNPALVDERKNIIDGRNRMEIAAELGLPCPVSVMRGLSDSEKRTIALQANEARRQLTGGDRKKMRSQRIKRVVGMRRKRASLATIAEAEGVSRTQVQEDIKEAKDRGWMDADDEPETVKGQDGVERPAQPAERPKEESKGKEKDVSRVDSKGKAKPVDTVTDRKGTEIPKRLRDVFADTWHADTYKLLKKLAKEAQSRLRWSAWLRPQIVEELQTAADRVKAAIPSHVCTECKGTGKDCAKCLASGYAGEGVA